MLKARRLAVTEEQKREIRALLSNFYNRPLIVPQYLYDELEALGNIDLTNVRAVQITPVAKR